MYVKNRKEDLQSLDMEQWKFEVGDYDLVSQSHTETEELRFYVLLTGHKGTEPGTKGNKVVENSSY